jgi:murein DD-endopeptidase MepM/ murein hydrolase activator NlpD
LSVALFLAFILGPFIGLGDGDQRAWAVTSAEKQAEADAAMAKLDELQTQLNLATENHTAAVVAHDEALQRMTEAREREDAATARIAELQKELGVRADEMYRDGNSSFLQVLFGARTFQDFITAIDYMNRVNSHDAKLVSETKEVKAQAEAARIEYTEQERIAAEKEQQVAQLKSELEEASANMQAQVEQLTAEVAELQAAEELAAEAARLAAEEAARIQAGGSSHYPGDLSAVGQLIHPCPGAYISSTFGYRSFDDSFHKGTDFAAGTGTPVYAAASGTVIIAGYDGGAGNWIVISHGNGMTTKYMHASELWVSAGQHVEAGQAIMAMGSTGYSTGPHLHFQVEFDGVAVDPMIFL